MAQVNDDEKGNDGLPFAKFKQQFDVNIQKIAGDYDKNANAKCLELKFVDQGTQNKFQIYHSALTLDNCSKILKQSKYEILPVSKFVDLVIFCLSDENEQHDVNVTVNGTKLIKLDILYKPDQFSQVLFSFTIPAKEMKEIDLLKLRLQELETSVPILFYEKLTAAKRREKGWNNYD